MKIKKIISRLLVDSITRSQSLGRIPVIESCDVIIDRPKISEHGDFSTNLPLALSKVCRMPPKKISEIIIEHINSDPSIRSIEFAPPGFINFFIENDYFYQELEKIQNDGLDYFRNNYGKKQKIQIEFVSVNPTGPLHVGHARGAVIGLSLIHI